MAILGIPTAEKSGQLFILHESETYTREGSFDPDIMIARLIAETEKAVAEGYPALRVTSEMTRVLRGYPGLEKLLEHEAKLNRDFFPKYPCLAICQYDRWKFDPEIIKGVVMLTFIGSDLNKKLSEDVWGADGYITKPFTHEALLEEIRWL